MAARGKILLIDDEILVREELGGLLVDEGFEVITGADGEEGLNLFRSNTPEMVITDVRMPRRDGLSLAITIRNEDPSVPVTIITGHGTETMAIEALRAGVTDFIKKPVRLEDLTAALHRMETARRHIGLNIDELPPSISLEQQTWVYTLENTRSTIPVFVDFLLKGIGGGMERGGILELSLAIREVLLNAMEHGNLELTYEDKSRALETGGLEEMLAVRSREAKYAGRRVTVSACREASCLTVRVADEGPGFDWRRLPDPMEEMNFLSAHGRGALLARLSVDSLSYNDKGNEVTLVKRLNSKGSPR